MPFAARAAARATRRAISMVLLATAAFGASAASATVFTVNLTADPASGSYSSTPGSYSFSLPLTLAGGSPDGTPFNIAVGDQIVANLALTSPITTPTLPYDGVIFFDPQLSQSLGTPPGGLTANTQSEAFLGGTSYGVQYSGCTNCIFSAYGVPAASTPFSFDSLSTTIDIVDLVPSDPMNPVAVNGFTLSFATFVPSAVPEPMTWALMIGGFGAVGGVLRRRTGPGGVAPALAAC